jgi:hypothetical protein
LFGFVTVSIGCCGGGWFAGPIIIPFVGTVSGFSVLVVVHAAMKPIAAARIIKFTMRIAISPQKFSSLYLCEHKLPLLV